MTTSPTTVIEQTPTVDRKRARFFLIGAVAMVGFAMSLQVGLNGNFVAQTMHIDEMQQGLLESVRESCGILALGILALLAGMSEPRIATIMLVLVSVGLTANAVVPSYGWLVLASFVWSQGLHVWMPLPNSMALALADKGREGESLGKLGAAGAIASAAAIVLAIGLDRLQVTIRPMWIFAGAAAFLAALACTGIPRNIKAPGARLIIRREYRLYYLLQFLEGWRKQIFIAFASYLLVKQYGTPLSTMLILFLISQAIGWFASPLTGRIIDRFGERAVLLFYYMTMAGVFACYAFVTNVMVLRGMFVADNVLFVCTMALTTYVGRIAPPKEHTATLSAGVAANHVASITMPLVGGILWHRFGYQWAFVAGTAMACITLIPVLYLGRRHETANHA